MTVRVGREQALTEEDELLHLLGEAKLLAKRYRQLTGRPLGLTGEIAEYEAVRLLKLSVAPVRQPGYDAIRATPHGIQRIQIKGRCILPESKPSQRLGGIKLHDEWDVALMVLLDGDFEATAMYEAERDAVEKALLEPGSIARNQRGALAVSKFKAIGRKVWPISADEPNRPPPSGRTTPSR